MRAYGWTTKGDIIPDEAEVIREVADAMLDGQTTGSIAADLNQRGIRTATGAAWQVPQLTRMVRNPRVAGLRDIDGVLHDHPTAPAILDRDTWTRVLDLFAKPDRQRFAPRSRRKHLATGFFRCAVCGEHCYVQTPEKGDRLLRASCDHVQVGADVAEQELAERVLSRITTPIWLDALTRTIDYGTDHYRRQIADADHRILVLAEVFGGTDGADQHAFTAGVDAARTMRGAAEGSLALIDSMGGLPAVTDREVVTWWAETATLDDQRAALSTVVDYVELRPGKRSSAGDRYVFHWL